MSVTQLLLPFGSAIIMAVLTYDIFRRYQQHHGGHTHLVFWGVGLGMFAVAAFCGGLLYFGWNEAAFIGWFLFGAMLNAAWIGQGTILLLVRKRWVTALSIILVIASVLAAIILLSTPLNGAQYQANVSVFEQYKSVLPTDAIARRILTPLFNIYGTIAVVGGALWSSYLFYKKEILPNRVIGNVLIAAGALAIGGAGTLTATGFSQVHELSQLVAAILIYAGFVFASRPAAVQENERTAAAKPVAAK
ncbi:MAG TPA: hypothetical protein VFD70_22850 [Anaerolineae bacterium]|nr:hypothetical protein [Anaerolineae bacterium]